MNRFLPALLLLTLCVGCAPVKIQEVRFPPMHRFLDRSNFTGDEPAKPTMELLKQLALDDQWSRDPDQVILSLRDRTRDHQDRELLGAMAELAFIRARHLEQDAAPTARKWYLAASYWSFGYLFHLDQTSPEMDLFNPRTHQQISIYNLALGRFLALVQKNAVDLNQHEEQLLNQRIRVTLEIEPNTLDPAAFSRAIPVTEIRPKGFRRIHRRWGLGIPITFYRENMGATIQETYMPPEGIVYPGTAVLTFPPPCHDATVTAHLRYYDPRDTTTTQIGTRRAPLSADLTTPYGYLLERAELKRLGRRGLLNGEAADFHRGVFLLEPYDPQKIPLVMIHGLMSSPATWIELTNDLNGEPDLRNHYQVWHYMYPTSTPYLYSARLLREDLEQLRRDLDPEGDDPAMAGMVFVAHSMGGLLTKTLVSDSKDHIWNQVYTVQPEALKGDPNQISKVNDIFHFKPKPYAKRVIFLSVPHHGSTLASNLIGRMSAGLVKLPDSFTDLFKAISQRNRDQMTPQMQETLADGTLTSIEALSPKHPILQALADLPISTDVPVHTIIGDRGKTMDKDPGDGIVTVASAHLPEAVSECIIPCTHDSPSHPKAILEIKRILRLHLNAHAAQPIH